jgi:lipopolysaccharide transport system ATP-binding protein
VNAGKQPVISLQNVGVAYKVKAGFLRRRRVWALQEVSFDVYEGETLGVIGKNGAGKSTLLQVLSGIILPDRGLITTKEGCQISLLSLQAGFVQPLTGRENAILSGMLFGIKPRTMTDMMDKIADFSGLGTYIDQPVNTYSTGMRARLGFAVAFYADPDIILIDEVLGVGDQEFKEKSEAAMRQKILSNKTVVIVSHNANTILELCDRVVWIENGASKMVGLPAEVVAQYQDQIYSRRNKNITGQVRQGN